MIAERSFFALVLLLFYFAMHSFLADDGVKKWFSERLGQRLFRFYRLGYNVLAVVFLVVLLGQMRRLSGDFLFEKTFFSNAAGGILLAVGAVLGLVSLRNYDLAEFVGSRQLTEKNAAPVHSTLNVAGLNSVVRHPLYLATVVGLVGFFVLFPKISSLVLLVGTLIYLPFGIFFEEKKLLRQFGAAYFDYQKRVKRLIPGLW